MAATLALATETALQTNIPKSELVFALEEAQEEKALPLAIEVPLATAAAGIMGYADGTLGDGKGALAKGAMAGAALATYVATQGQGDLAKGARTVFTAALTIGAHEVAKGAGLAAAARRAAERAEKKPTAPQAEKREKAQP